MQGRELERNLRRSSRGGDLAKENPMSWKENLSLLSSCHLDVCDFSAKPHYLIGQTSLTWSTESGGRK